MEYTLENMRKITKKDIEKMSPEELGAWGYHLNDAFIAYIGILQQKSTLLNKQQKF